MNASRRIPLALALLLALTQLALAWHGPSHLHFGPGDDAPVVQTADCDLCLPGASAAASPARPENRTEPVQDLVPAVSGQPLVSSPRLPGAGPRAPPELA